MSPIKTDGVVAKLPKLMRRLVGRGCGAADFAPVYARSKDDAWGYERRPFERERFDLIMDVMSGLSARRLLEVGCAEGHLTRRLSGLAEEVVACDVVAEALRRAKEHCEGLTHVQFLLADIRKTWPSGTFDAMICSDVLYYFTKREVRGVLRRSAHRVSTNGHFLFANEWQDGYRWHTHPDYVVAQLAQSGDWDLVRRERLVDREESRTLIVTLWRRNGIAGHDATMPMEAVE
ncbi:MAG: methyltransferase domain-containing protein [Planctomycetes bacterium]|nr:methyltransferase domain-containing protein [Planctomycetota bacterium]